MVAYESLKTKEKSSWVIPKVVAVTYWSHIKFCKQNTTKLIVLRENLLCKTSTRHWKNSKQSAIVAIDSSFALFGARQYGVTTRESSDKNTYWSRRLRELFITKFKSQFKRGFSNVVVTRAGRLREWSQKETLRLYDCTYKRHHISLVQRCPNIRSYSVLLNICWKRLLSKKVRVDWWSCYAQCKTS